MTQSLLTPAGLSDPGLQRQENEDSWSGPPPNLAPEQIAAKGFLYVVADGVGGHQGGEVASQIAVQVVQQVYYADPNPDIRASLMAAIQEANRQIYHQGISNAGQYGMSTTITAAVVRGSELVTANVGDSRVYLVKNGQAHLLTVDHTWVEERRRAGILTDAEAANHPQRNVITRSLGSALEVQVDVFGPHPLVPGDQVLLCSDGLSDLVNGQEMAAVVAQSRNPSVAARQLIDLAKRRGAPDNVTAVLLSLGMGGKPAAAPAAPATLLGLAGMIGAVLLVAAVAVVLRTSRSAPPPVPRPTATPTPSPMVTPTPVATPTPLPTPKLGEPDGTEYHIRDAVKLTWTWSETETLKENQRFVIEITGAGQVLTRTVRATEFTFQPGDLGLTPGGYHWTVWVEQKEEGVWEVVAQAPPSRIFRVLPRPTLAPTFTPTPIPPTETPTPIPTTQPPPPPPPPTETPPASRP